MASKHVSVSAPPIVPQGAARLDICRPCNALETLFAASNVRFAAGASFPAVPIHGARQALRRALADCPAGWVDLTKSESNAESAAAASDDQYYICMRRPSANKYEGICVETGSLANKTLWEYLYVPRNSVTEISLGPCALSSFAQCRAL